MEPEERARGAREGGPAEALRPPERVLEASVFAPLEVKVQKWRKAVSECSVNGVDQVPFRCRHFCVLRLSGFAAAGLLEAVTDCGPHKVCTDQPRIVGLPRSFAGMPLHNWAKNFTFFSKTIYNLY